MIPYEQNYSYITITYKPNVVEAHKYIYKYMFESTWLPFNP